MSMLTITIQVNRPSGQAIGIKEQIAMDLEKYGDVRVVRIDEAPADAPQQIAIPGFDRNRYGGRR